MRVAGLDLVLGGKPRPCSLRRTALVLHAIGQRGIEQTAFVMMMVMTSHVQVRHEHPRRRWLTMPEMLYVCLLYSPAEAINPILVYCLEEEQDASNLEYRGADECGHTTPNENLVVKGRGRAYEREEYKETVEYPQSAAPGEHVRHPPGHVPDGVTSQHQPDVVRDGAPACSGLW